MASAATIIRRRKRRIERKTARETTRRTWTILFSVLVFVLVILPGGVVMGGTAVLYTSAASRLPTPQDSLFADNLLTATTFYDRTGETPLYAVRDPLGDRRIWVSLDSLPAYVIDATLLVEDPDFWTATRFDPVDMLVRLWHNLLVGPPPPDPSITGRLVRNVVAPLPDVTAGESVTEQRAQEIALVAEANRKYTPAEILEWHLNTNYYGSEAYGIEAAAQIYLGKPAAALTLDEAALLVSIPPAPAYNPFDNPTAARGRQADTLRALFNAGKISEAQYTEAANVETIVQPANQYRPPIAPDYLLYARQQAEMILDGLGRDGKGLVARGGLRIVTALDLNLQMQAECTLTTQLARLRGDPASPQAADGSPCTGAAYLPLTAAPTDADLAPDSGSIVVLDAETGEVKAMVGAGLHAPGATLQPFVYFEGFRRGLFTPATMVFDVPTEFPGAVEGLIYVVGSANGSYRGPMNLREAMGAGLLPPAANVAYRLGMSNVLRTAHQLGLNSLNETDYSLMLLERGGEVAPLDVAYAYSVFAGLGKIRGIPVEPIARGYRGRDPVAMQRIEDKDGNVLWEYDAELASSCNTLDFCTPLMEAGLAYLINDVLADQETRWPLLGQENALELARPSAVINGLTDDGNWTAGYTPQIVTVVHLGRADEGDIVLDDNGMSGAAAIWRAVMEYIHRRDQLPSTDWVRPDSVIETLVCDRSGFLPNGVCPVKTEIFMDGTAPTRTDTYWQEFEINRQSGRLATASTPPELISEARFFVPPDEVAEWWRTNNQPLPPTELDTISRPNALSANRISSPLPFAYVGGVVEILGAVDLDNIQYFQLAYGESLNPSEWIELGGQQTTLTPGAPLATWDTNGLDGLYSLRLSVVLEDNTVQREIVQVTVDNVAPRITLNTSEPNKIYRWPGDDVVTLEADVQDNLTVDHVEFFHNGEYLGSDDSRPYGFDWTITSPGIETFSAVAFDTVGNQSSSQISVQILRSGS
jgi:membrane peptidoglycan carboxypeptidase